MSDNKDRKAKETWRDSLKIADAIASLAGAEGLGDFDFKWFFDEMSKDDEKSWKLRYKLHSN